MRSTSLGPPAWASPVNHPAAALRGCFVTSREPGAGVEGRVDQKFDLELRGAAGGGVRATVSPESLKPSKSPGLRVRDEWLASRGLHA